MKRYCIHCGYENNSSNKKCIKCGKNINDIDSDLKELLFGEVKDKILDKGTDLITSFIKNHLYGIILTLIVVSSVVISNYVSNNRYISDHGDKMLSNNETTTTECKLTINGKCYDYFDHTVNIYYTYDGVLDYMLVGVKICKKGSNINMTNQYSRFIFYTYPDKKFKRNVLAERLDYNDSDYTCSNEYLYDDIGSDISSFSGTTHIYDINFELYQRGDYTIDIYLKQNTNLKSYIPGSISFTIDEPRIDFRDEYIYQTN